MGDINRLDYSMNKINIIECTNFIVDEFRKSNKKEIVIVNIGTDRIVGDSFGPIVGTLLRENEVWSTVYGSLEKPMHALNLINNIKHIKETHKNAFIIAIDAALSTDSEMYSLTLRKGHLRPGIGVGKNLCNIGDLAIMITCGKDYEEMQSARLGMIYKVAKMVCIIIKEVEKETGLDD